VQGAMKETISEIDRMNAANMGNFQAMLSQASSDAWGDNGRAAQPRQPEAADLDAGMADAAPPVQHAPVPLGGPAGPQGSANDDDSDSDADSRGRRTGRGRNGNKNGSRSRSRSPKGGSERPHQGPDRPDSPMSPPPASPSDAGGGEGRPKRGRNPLTKNTKNTAEPKKGKTAARLEYSEGDPNESDPDGDGDGAYYPLNYGQPPTSPFGTVHGAAANAGGQADADSDLSNEGMPVDEETPGDDGHEAASNPIEHQHAGGSTPRTD
jgi:hypothetical protein